MRLLAVLLLLPSVAFAQFGPPSAVPRSGGSFTGAITAPQVNIADQMYSTSVSALSSLAYVSGTAPTGLVSLGAHTFTVTGDTMNYTGQNYLSTIHLDHNFGGSGMQGSRAGLDISMVMRGTTSNVHNTNAYYVGLSDYIQCSYNDNGVDAAFADVSGSCVGANIRADLGTGTFWYTLNAEEIDVVSTAGSSSAHTFGTLSVKSGTGGRGLFDDAAIAFVNGTAGSTWDTLIQVGKTDGTPSTSSTSYLLRCVSPVGTTTPCPAGYGIDLSNFTVTNFAFRSPGFSVDGAGNQTVKTTKTNVVTVSALPTCNSAAEGTRAGVTDATSATPGATLVGGGSNHVPAYCNGTNWVAF
jgi:hypothetical protein